MRKIYRYLFELYTPESVVDFTHEYNSIVDDIVAPFLDDEEELRNFIYPCFAYECHDDVTYVAIASLEDRFGSLEETFDRCSVEDAGSDVLNEVEQSIILQTLSKALSVDNMEPLMSYLLEKYKTLSENDTFAEAVIDAAFREIEFNRDKNN